MGALKQTRTCVTLEVSEITYAEIAGKLRIAGYDRAFNPDGAIDMHGLALVKETPRDPKAEPGEQFNEFCREPPCASLACRRNRRCEYA
jgi:hypothetical protein